MSYQSTSLRRMSLAIGALWACLGMAPCAQAADKSPQQVAMACTQTADCQRNASSATTRHATEAIEAKKGKVVTPARSKAPVDVERDLWRHQSSS